MPYDKRLIYGIIMVCAATACRVVPEPYSLNKSVKQKVKQEIRDSVVVIPGALYEAGPLKRFFLGDHYRDTWLTPVKVPILNFKKEKGGLTILDRGGGQQTYSLKLKGADGRLYSLRSIQKDPSPTLPLPLQYSFADDIVQDQISASNPFGAFILPPLEDAAGIYHTNPKMVYIPDLPVLGKYRQAFGGVLAMIEEDADEDWSGYEDFGYTKNAVSTHTVRDELKDDNENRVDQESFLRERLFDMWVGDWDRHEGQFRWAEFEDDRGKYYRPIPEDRDNVFFKFDGFFPWWASRKWALRKFQSFDDDIRDIAGLNYNARYLDRRLLTGLSESQWITIAEDLQQKLTDNIIEKAIQQLPKAVYAIDGKFLEQHLKARRDRLVVFAQRYYKILARQVDIVGSDNNEYVEVSHSDQTTSVTMYDATDDGEKKGLIYQRKFDAHETQEIRIYTRGDEDFIYLFGEAKAAPKVRVIGGLGEDVYQDSSEVKSHGPNNFFYDNEKGTRVKPGKETRLTLSNNLNINRYDFEGFKYNYLGPTLFIGYNSDDGPYIGGGVVIKTHGFRKEPYAAYHRIAINMAPKSFAWNFDYEGDFKKVIGDMGFNINAKIKVPNYFTNFYGYGNETTFDDQLSDDYYRIRYKDIHLFPGLTFEPGDHAVLKFGPDYRYVRVESSEATLLGSLGQNASYIYDGNHYLGARFTADIKTIKNEHYPKNGIKWASAIEWQTQLNNTNTRMGKFSSALSAYYSFGKPTLITLASRIGASAISGDYAFYQASTIGGNEGMGRMGKVRGYERDRFTGRSSIYQNNEIRIRLARIPFYYVPFSVGILGHFDQGRVWVDGENSSKWHKSYGGGLWFHPLGKWVFTTTYSHSEENNLLMFSLGFMF